MTSIDTEKVNVLKQYVSEAGNIVVTAHMSPDGDAVGSSLGLSRILTNMGKTVKVVLPDDMSKHISFLPGAKSVSVFCRGANAATSAIESADLIICLDFNDLKRIDRMAAAVEKARARKVLIDHHLDPTDFCDITISHPELSSTCMLVYKVSEVAGWDSHIDTDAATCLLAGMMTDTGNFSYNSNDPGIFPIVGALVAKGVDHDTLCRRLFDTYSESCLRLNAYAISRKMKVWKEYGAALITLTRNELNMYHYSRGDTEGLVNKPLAIPGVVYSAFLREEENYIKVSMRSIGDFPCDKVCSKYFGGGGHLNAAGGELTATMAQAVQIFESILPKNKAAYIDKKENKNKDKEQQ